jgi:hypothetical protein
MPFSLTWLPTVLKNAGLKVVEVPGWKTRGHGDIGTIKGIICHHTAGPKTGNMPSLRTVRDGLPGFSGPLAQLCLGRDGTFYVVAAGKCFHAGVGEWKNITTGNTSFIGIEAENTGTNTDIPWPTEQMDAYRRGVAAILKHIGQDEVMCCGHKEYALPRGRENDPTFDMDQFRKDVAAIMYGAALPPVPIPYNDPDGWPTLRREITKELAHVRSTQDAVSVAWNNPAWREALIANPRTADIAMQRQNPDKSEGKFIGKRDILATLTAYRIRVQIGDRSPVSIISGDPPSIDILLPPPIHGRNHVLHVALFTDDFDLKSPILQRLELPEAGPSQPLYFDVVTRQVKEQAQARLSIYYDLPPGADGSEVHRNHLIQSFILLARVGEKEGKLDWRERGVEAILDFSLTERFVDLEVLKPRMLSLALNDGPGLESHKLMMKRGSEAAAVGFTEAEIADSINSLREELEWASNTDEARIPRFPAGETGKPQEFDKVIRKLAKLGKSLHNKLFLSAEDDLLIEGIKSAIKRCDDVIQVIQLARNYPFPWPLLYDFELPQDIVGAPPPLVCKDFLRKHDDGRPYSCQECLANCHYPNKQQTVCVYGFWGSRHQTEQLLSSRKGYVKPESLKPVGPGSVGFMLGIDTFYVAPIPQELADKLAHSQGSPRKIDSNPNLLDILWDDAQRPAILLLVGHYMTKDAVGEPSGPRITLPEGRFLQPGDIVAKSMNSADWKDPHTVVLLAACEGGVVEIKESVNFVSTFLRAGAGAVIGPEAKIYDGLARRFGVDLSTAMIVDGMAVGPAMLAFRRKLLLELNPLGFAFTAYGFADLAASKNPTIDVAP